LGPSHVRLRDVIPADLPIFFAFQLDAEANRMAAFTAKDPTDRAAFLEHWHKIMGQSDITQKTILFDGQVAGNILSFARFGDSEVGYWLGKQYWGKGIATRALTEFLTLLKTRPLFARAAKDNAASIRVLEKCGFKVSGEDKGFAEARGEEVEEFIFKLR